MPKFIFQDGKKVESAPNVKKEVKANPPKAQVPKTQVIPPGKKVYPKTDKAPKLTSSKLKAPKANQGQLTNKDVKNIDPTSESTKIINMTEREAAEELMNKKSNDTKKDVFTPIRRKRDVEEYIQNLSSKKDTSKSKSAKDDGVVNLDSDGVAMLINAIVDGLVENFVTKDEVESLVKQTLQKMVIDKGLNG